MKLAFKQFRVLMWKCFIIRKRHYVTSLFELLFSLIANVIMVLVVNSINQKMNPLSPDKPNSNTQHQLPWVNETIWQYPVYNLSDNLWKFVYAKPTILYTPKNDITTTFIKELESVLSDRVVLNKTRVNYVGLDNENDLLNEYAKLNSNRTKFGRGIIGIVFETSSSTKSSSSNYLKKKINTHLLNNNYLSINSSSLSNSLILNDNNMEYFLNNFAYKLRTNIFSVNGFFPEKNDAGPYTSNLYLEDDYTMKSFLEAQIFINEAYLSLLLKQNNIDLIDKEMKDYYKKKKKERSKQYEELLKRFKELNETLGELEDYNLTDDDDVNEDLNKKIHDYLGDKFTDQAIDDLNIILLYLHNKNKNSTNKLILPPKGSGKYPEFIKLALDFLVFDHPLFVKNIKARQMPYPKYITRPPTSLIDLVPYVLTNGFICLVPVIVKRIVDEKVNRIRDTFRLMGLKDSIYFLSIFTNYFIAILPQIIIITALYTSSFFGLSSPVYDYTSPFLVFFILLIYCVHLILMSMLISIPISRPVIGIVISVVVFLCSGLPHYFLDIRFNKGLNPNSLCIWQILSCVLPNMSINFIFRLISLKELYNYGADFTNLFEYTHMYGIMSIGLLMIVQIFSCFIIIGLIWYFDAVWPNEFGLHKHWLFPFKSIKKWYSKSKNEEDFDDFFKNLNTKSIKRPEDLEIRNKYFEDEETLKIDKIAILIRNLTKIYKSSANNEKVALDCVNLKLIKNQLTAILGHNAAGKTTLMSVITGFINWNEGEVFINGYNMKTNTKLARKSISLCPQHNVLYDELNCEEHLYLYSVIKGEPSYRIQYDIGLMLDKLQLTKKSKIQSSNLSGGMKRKLNLAIALIGSSKIVILDEPTSGMDHSARRLVWDLLLEARRSKTILLSTHYLEEADAVADKITIMSQGKIHCYGSPVFLKQSFGTGYQLRIQKSHHFSSENREMLSIFIKKHFESSKRYTESQGEIIYLLNGNNDSSCSETVKDGQFATFFHEFENLKENLSISSCGISVTTLEDVFLRVTASHEFIFDIQYNNGNVAKKTPLPSIDFGRKTSRFENAHQEDVTLTSYKETNGLDLSNLQDVELHSCNDSTMEMDEETEEVDNCCLLFLQRFKALIIKRILYLKQTYLMLIIQLIIPLLVFSIILYIDQFLRSRLHFDQPFELNYNLMYQNEKSTAYFQHNNQFEFEKEYEESAKLNGINKVESVESNLDLNRVILDRVNEIGISNYVQSILVGASDKPIIKKKPKLEYQKDLDVWFQNEVLHSLPISINQLYESIFRHLGLYSTDNELKPLRIHTTNHPFPNQLHYMYHFTSIQQFKIMWSLIISLSLPFLGAYYSVFVIQEQLSKSKLLQTMTGLSTRLYWFANFFGDFIIHLFECGLVIILFYCIDNVGVFTDFNQTMIALFILIFLYGICSMILAYIYSFFASEVSTGYVLYVIFNLIFGLILSLCDYIIFYLTEYAVISKNIYQNIIWIFRIFPLYSMTQGIVHLYVIGSKAHVCDNIGNDILMMTCNSKNKESVIFGCCKDACGDNCYEYKSPFNFSPEGVLNEILMMISISFVSLLLLVVLESNINFRGRLKLLFSKKETFKKTSFLVEDIDVSLERNRIDNLIETNEPEFINKNDALIVQNLCKRYPNGYLAVNKLSFSVQNQECFGFCGVNSAGKTTAFKMLVGDLPLSSGNAWINGFDLRSNLKRFQQQIGYVPQFDALIGHLTGEELLYLYARLRGIPERFLKQKISQIVQMTDLSAHYKRLSSNYSGGTRRKLSLAIAILGNPKIIFLDEPTAGVDSMARRKIWKTLEYIRRVHNVSILLTSHSMEECEALSSRLAIMINGQLKVIGSIQQLRKKYGVGYSLTIKINQKYANNNNNSEYIRKLKERITSTFNQCLLKDIHQTVISYQILDSSLSWSFLFSNCDAIKREFYLEYYLLSDTTLEQIFINFARQD